MNDEDSDEIVTQLNRIADSFDAFLSIQEEKNKILEEIKEELHRLWLAS